MEIGTQIGPYRVDALLGQGGMASVYRVWHTGLHRNEALKLLTPQMTYDRVFVERFLAEARTAANLRHPHIGMLYNVSTPEAEVPYFTMELIEGGDLAVFLEQSGCLTLSDALPILANIADALDYAHANGVVHRDVKPANILLDREGAGTSAKIVDFGIARAMESSATRLTKAGMLVGTPSYISPEQAGNGQAITERSDQYSLAVVAYEMLCGRPPFTTNEFASPIAILMCHIRETPPVPTSLSPGLPRAASDALMRALLKYPEERFATCSAFVDALAQSASGLTKKPQPSSPSIAKSSESLSVPAPKRGGKMTAVVAGSVIAGLSLIAFGYFHNQGSQPAAISTTAPAHPIVSPSPSASPQPIASTSPSTAQPINSASVAVPPPAVSAGQQPSQTTINSDTQAAQQEVDDVANAIAKYNIAKHKGQTLTTDQAAALRTMLSTKCNSALAHCDSAIAANEYDVQAWKLKVRALRYQGWRDQATDAKNKAIGLMPNDVSLKSL